MSTLALRTFEYWLYRYRRTWRASAFTTLLSPVLFLAAMGLGLGSLVDRGAGPAILQGPDYLTFLAPGLLAATAMMTGVSESTWPVMSGIRWQKTYFAMLATPVGPRDILGGHFMFVVFRVLVTSVAFLAVSAAFGALRSPWALLAVPAALLTGMAYSAPVSAFAVTQRSEKGFITLNRFGVVPMFLFSGTFFPVDQLPGAVQPLAYATPLWHGVELCRGASLGILAGDAVAVHVAYLGAWVAVGVLLARYAFTRRLAV
jgi:lipooligosaccharide transport system permease protein